MNLIKQRALKNKDFKSRKCCHFLQENNFFEASNVIVDMGKSEVIQWVSAQLLSLASVNDIIWCFDKVL